MATSTSADGRLHVLHHWGWGPQTVSAPAPLRDLLTDEEVAPGATLQLGAWDVRVFQQHPSERNVISMTDPTPGDQPPDMPSSS